MLVNHFVLSPLQKFISVRKEDAGEYFCRAKNDAGYSECPPQMMEVCKWRGDVPHNIIRDDLKGNTDHVNWSCLYLISTDDIDVVGIILGVLVVVTVLVCITVGICCAYKRGYFSSQKQTGNK